MRRPHYTASNSKRKITEWVVRYCETYQPPNFAKNGTVTKTAANLKVGKRKPLTPKKSLTINFGT